MRTFIAMAVFAAIPFGLACSHNVQAEEASNSKFPAHAKESKEEAEQLATSKKGFELYSWKVKDSWCFALLAGTNQHKTNEEITAPQAKLDGMDALKRALKKIAKGQTIIWSVGKIVGGQKDADPEAYPSDELQKELEKACEDLGLKLVLDHC
ncbi:MAG: hypothetical protein HY291_05570 [Planctomycetes bacterium]|nr:hypothetical protein [Planctomycetota bacterium]